MILNAELEKFIADNLDRELSEVALKYSGKSTFDLRFALDQLNGRQRAKHKLPTFLARPGIIYPNKISLEQCSSEQTALYKASLLSGKTLVDLTGGFGVDSFFSAKNFEQTTYFERNKSLHEITCRNFKTLGAKNIITSNEDSLEALKNRKEKADWIFLDPARRDTSQKKVFRIEDCEPDVLANIDLLMSKGNNLLMKFSPLLDLQHIAQSLPNVQALHVVALKNECKELLIEIAANAATDSDTPIVHCVNLKPDGEEKFTAQLLAQKERAAYSVPDKYIYEPNAAIQKAGLQDALAQKFFCKKLAANTQLLTSSKRLENFPGRIFELEESVALKKEKLQALTENGKANVISRNFPMKAEEIYRKFKIIPGGNTYLIACTLDDESKVVLICKRLK